MSDVLDKLRSRIAEGTGETIDTVASMRGMVPGGGGPTSGLGRYLQEFLNPKKMGSDIVEGVTAIPGALGKLVDYTAEARQEYPFPGGLGVKMGVDAGMALASQPWENIVSGVGRTAGGLAAALGGTVLSGGNPVVGGMAFEPGRQAYDLVEDVMMNKMRRGARALGADVADPDPMRSIEDVAQAHRRTAVGEGVGFFGPKIAGGMMNKTRDAYRHFVPSKALQRHLDLDQPSSVASVHQIPRGSSKETLAQANQLGQDQKRIISEYNLVEGLPVKQGDVSSGRLALEGYEFKTNRLVRELTDERDTILQEADKAAEKSFPVTGSKGANRSLSGGYPGVTWENVRDLEFYDIVDGKRTKVAPIKELTADIEKAKLNKANAPRAAAMEEALNDYMGDFVKGKKMRTPMTSQEMTTTLQSIDQELRELKEFDASTLYNKDSGLKPSDRAGLKGRIHALKKIRAGIKESLLQYVDEAVPGSRARLDKVLEDLHAALPIPPAQKAARDALRIERQSLDQGGSPARFYYRFGGSPGVADSVTEMLGGQARNLRRMNEAPGDMVRALREMTNIYRGEPPPAGRQFIPSAETRGALGSLAGAMGGSGIPSYGVPEGSSYVVFPPNKKKAVGGSLADALNPFAATPAQAQEITGRPDVNSPMSKYVPALVQQESSGDPNAIGPETQYGTAKGLFQLLDSTGEEWHQRLGIEEPYDPHDPEQAELIGKAYLDHLYEMFGDEKLALAAYNWGMGNLRRLLSRSRERTYEGIRDRLPGETRDYVRNITDNTRRTP